MSSLPGGTAVWKVHHRSGQRRRVAVSCAKVRPCPRCTTRGVFVHRTTHVHATLAQEKAVWSWWARGLKQVISRKLSLVPWVIILTMNPSALPCPDESRCGCGSSFWDSVEWASDLQEELKRHEKQVNKSVLSSMVRQALRSGQWRCARCMSVNLPRRRKCYACSLERPKQRPGYDGGSSSSDDDDRQVRIGRR